MCKIGAVSFKKDLILVDMAKPGVTGGIGNGDGFHKEK